MNMAVTAPGEPRVRASMRRERNLYDVNLDSNSAELWKPGAYEPEGMVGPPEECRTVRITRYVAPLAFGSEERSM